MDRRGFLGTLLASLGTLAIDPEALLWRPPVEAAALPVVRPEAVLALQQITQQMLRQIEARLALSRDVPLARADHDGAVHLGHTVYPDPTVVLNRQWHVVMAVPETVDAHGLDVARYVTPAALTLVAPLTDRSKGPVRGCGELPLLTEGYRRRRYESARATNPQTGLSVRGVLAYDPARGERLRFDMLVAQ